MINRLYLQNFQAIKEPTEIPIHPLTLLVGPNSAGKSAIRDALTYLRAVFAQDHEFRRMSNEWVYRSEGGALGLPIHASHVRVGASLKFKASEFGRWTFTEELENLLLQTNVSFEQPHLDVLRALDGSQVQIVFRGSIESISIAVNGNAFLNVHGGRRAELGDGIRSRLNSGEAALIGEVLEECHFGGTVEFFDGHTAWPASLRSYFRAMRQLADSRSVHVRSMVRATPDRVFFDGIIPIKNERGFVTSFYGERPEVTIADLDLEQFSESGLSLVRNLRTRWKDFQTYLDTRDDTTTWLNLVVRAICDVGLRSAEMAVVPGDRGVLTDAQVQFAVSDMKQTPDSDIATYGAATLLNGKSAIAAGEIQAKGIQFAVSHLMQSLRGYRLRTSGYKLSPIGQSMTAGESCHQYKGRVGLEDAQGRLLEFSEVGSGLSFVIPIVLALGRWPISFIEQPELHLHPAAQSDLADVFIYFWSKHDRMAIIETHSEHLILRLLRRIRQTSKKTVPAKHLCLNPDDLCILYFDPQTDGSTQVLEIIVDQQGEFVDRWPSGFFSEREKELFDE